MGCICNRAAKITPVIKPEPRVKQTSTKKPTRSSSPADKSLLDTSIIPPQDSKDTYQDDNKKFVEIQAADPQAFPPSFIQQRQSAIDNQTYRSAIQSWRPTSLEQLANLCKSFGRSKSLVHQHWIIYYWIACNIEYDTVSYFTKNYADQTAEGVFRTKKGVCAGYANIYKHVCDVLNLPCEKVSGYSKGYGFDCRKGAPTETDHAWNAVRIDNHWYLMESTWAAGHLNEEKKFERELDTYYFLPRPEEMIYHHLPEDEKWQLLQQSVKMDQYLEMPKLRPLYFEMKLELVSPRNRGHVDFVEGKPYALVLVRTPDDVRLLGDLKLDDKKIEGGYRIQFDHKRKVHCCYFAPNTTGTHTINIYAKHGDSVGEYSQAIDLQFDVRKMPKDRISFPKIWDRFFDLKLKIKSPKNTHLIKVHNGRREGEVRIEVPDDVELTGDLQNNHGVEMEGAHLVFYDRTQSLWVCKFAPNQDGIFDANILAKKKSEKGLYFSAVSFKIDAKNVPKPPLSYPKTWQLFYDLELGIISPHNRGNAVWAENASFTEIRVSAPDDVQISCGISFQGKKNENCSLAQFDHKKGHWQLLFAPQREGLHQLTIYAKRSGDDGSSSNSVAEFTLNVTKVRKSMRFPVQYGKFLEKKCFVYEPLNGVLKRGAKIPIHCFIPGAKGVNIAVDGKWLDKTGYNDSILKREINVGSKDVIIYGLYGEGDSYNALVEYSIE